VNGRPDGRTFPIARGWAVGGDKNRNQETPVKRNKSVWIPLAVAALVMAGMAARPQMQSTFAFVDVPKLMEQVPGFPEARAVFEGELQQRQDELRGLEEEMNSLIEQYERQQPTMNSTTRQRREEQIREVQRQLQDKAQQFEEQAREREQVLLGPLQEKAQAVIDAFRAERNLSIIIDITMDGSGIVAYDPQLDVTDILIQRVKRGTD
jgi:Skp family chaperone for outer membrane proteins